MRWKSMKPIGSAGASTASKPNCDRCRRVSDRRSRTSHPIARANSAYLEGPDYDACGYCGICPHALPFRAQGQAEGRSEEHTSELQSLMRISYAVFCLKKKQLL